MSRLAPLILATGLVLGACTAGEPGGATTEAASSAPVGCGEVERPPVQVSSHLIGDAEPPAPYSSVPPTSGWHSAEAPEPGFAPEPLSDPQVVSALEAGLVVVAVGPGRDLDDPVLEDLADQFRDRMLVTAYEPEMPTDVALLTWGALQRCDTIDPAAITPFVLQERVAPQEH